MNRSIAAFLLGAALAAAPAGAAVRVTDAGGNTVAVYAESYALVIGVSNYTAGWPRLRGVRDDIPAVKAALEKQGFQEKKVGSGLALPHLSEGAEQGQPGCETGGGRWLTKAPKGAAIWQCET